MERDHAGRNVWTSVSEEVLERSYGEDSVHDEDDLLDDLRAEGYMFEEDEVEEVYSELLEEMPVTGEDIERKLEDYSPV